MLTSIRLKLRGYKREPFSFIETIDSLEKNYQYELTVVEDNARVLHFSIEDDNDNIFTIIDKVAKEPYVMAIEITDWKNKEHYYKILERK